MQSLDTTNHIFTINKKIKKTLKIKKEGRKKNTFIFALNFHRLVILLCLYCSPTFQKKGQMNLD